MKRKTNIIIEKEILIDLYEKYSMNKICKILDIGRIRLEKLFLMYTIPKKTMSEIINLKTVKQETKETTIKKYGVEYYTQTDEYKERNKNTCLEKYGVEYYTQTDECKEKMKSTSLEKYGVEYYTQTDEYKERNKNTCLEKYGVDNVSKSQLIIDKISKTFNMKYGVDYYSQTDECKEKMKSTSLEKYGVEYYSQTDECKEKVKKTSLEKYGVDNYSKTEKFKKSCKNTCLEKYNTESVFNIKENIEKSKNIMFEKYGVEHGFQSDLIQERCFNNMYKITEYKFNSGRIDKTLGYEHFMLDILIKNNVNEDDIFTNYNCPKIIWYDELNKKHIHIPDIYIKSENKIIEVKSSYTSRDDLMTNILLKKKYSEKEGYIYIVNIISNKGEIIKTIY